VEASPRELDAVLISRMLGNRDRVMIGAGLPAPRAGALLAALTFAPGLRVCQALGWLSLEDQKPPAIPRAGMDIRDSAGAEALMDDHEAYDDVRRLSTVFVIGGLEIDAGGASNLLGVHRDGRWVRRGPGAIGTTSMAVLAGRTVLYSTRHDPQTFVEECSLVSAPGWRENPDRGPRFCVTPAGVFDFPAPERRMRLVATRPGWDLERIREATGFALDVVPDAGPVDPPTGHELGTLRDVVDPTGALR
jgi:glutaconate CoA-transferase subunit B